MSLLQKKSSIPFNINNPGMLGGLFGFPYRLDEARIVILPVPWDVTASHFSGAAKGPEAVMAASRQIDFYYEDFPDLWEYGICMAPQSEFWQKRNQVVKKLSRGVITAWEKEAYLKDSEPYTKWVEEVNAACRALNQWVAHEVTGFLDQGKSVGLLGGDHSVSLGYLEALAGRYPSFGIFHIDAHMDLRKCYEDFTYSHASIMYNALKLNEVSHLVQVGVRDYCHEEIARVNASKERVKSFTDAYLKAEQFQGRNWDDLCTEIVGYLPEYVYISFDIDGLSPDLCPHTGTPVPGGLQYAEVVHLIKRLSMAGRRIIGFDLVEVAQGPDVQAIDGNVGARLLYQLCGYQYLSQ